MTTTDDLALIGAITGILGTIVAFSGLALQFYKTWKERTRLDFTIERSYFSPPTKSGLNSYVVGFQILVNNEGKRSTTIHSATISFPYDDKTFSRNIEITNENTVKPDSTQRIQPQFWFLPSDVNIQGDLQNIRLTIHYTHGKKEFSFPTISPS